MLRYLQYGFLLLAHISCMAYEDKKPVARLDDTTSTVIDSNAKPVVKREVISENAIAPQYAASTIPDSLLDFARSLQGIPYLYASTDPAKGFDCSGFITYVFNHFNIKVPRSSVDFTNYGQTISLAQAKPGDLILFTGTDSTIRIVGHMGIIESWKNDSVFFIHSTSGHNKGVVITSFEKYYRSRFVKVIRVFPSLSEQ